MKSILLATALVLALPAGAALADEAIANNTATSMGTPAASPEYAAPRSAVIPGLPTQERLAQQRNRDHERQLEAKLGEVGLAAPGTPAAN
jgi:hypothetical protein